MRLLIFILLLISYKVSDAQSSSSECLILNGILNSRKVKSSFDLTKNNEPFVLYDRSNYFLGKCDSIFWGNKVVKISTDTHIVAKLSNMNPYYLFRNNCNVFIIDSFSNKNDVKFVSISQPCSGLSTECFFKYRKQKIRLISLKKYVL